MNADLNAADGGAHGEHTGDPEVEWHLRTALEHATDPTTRFHLRQALQLFEGA